MQKSYVSWAMSKDYGLVGAIMVAASNLVLSKTEPDYRKAIETVCWEYYSCFHEVNDATK